MKTTVSWNATQFSLAQTDHPSPAFRAKKKQYLSIKLEGRMEETDDEEEEITSYWTNLGKREDSEI